MAKVIGFKKQEYSFPDGKKVTGMSIYTTYPLSGDGTGIGASRDFVSDAKLGKCGYVPMLHDEINFTYNRYGKIDSVILVNQGK